MDTRMPEISVTLNSISIEGVEFFKAPVYSINNRTDREPVYIKTRYVDMSTVAIFIRGGTTEILCGTGSGHGFGNTFILTYNNYPGDAYEFVVSSIIGGAGYPIDIIPVQWMMGKLEQYRLANASGYLAIGFQNTSGYALHLHDHYENGPLRLYELEDLSPHGYYAGHYLPLFQVNGEKIELHEYDQINPHLRERKLFEVPLMEEINIPNYKQVNCVDITGFLEEKSLDVKETIEVLRKMETKRFVTIYC